MVHVVMFLNFSARPIKLICKPAVDVHDFLLGSLLNSYIQCSCISLEMKSTRRKCTEGHDTITFALCICFVSHITL